MIPPALISFRRGPLPRHEINNVLPEDADIFVPFNFMPSTWTDLYLRISFEGGTGINGTTRYRAFDVTAYLGRMTILETLTYMALGITPRRFNKLAYILPAKFVQELSI